MKTVLTIAGSDCSGGAGIQADLKTFAAHKTYGMSVITALTAQNTTGVYDVTEVETELVAKQLDCVFMDIFPDAVKIGMVANAKIIEVIAQKLGQYGAKNIVVDPVMVSTSGSRLIDEAAADTLVRRLFPLASVITPNIPEAGVLTDMDIRNAEEMECAANKLSAQTSGAVLLKGGHMVETASDLLLTKGETVWLRARRIDNPNTHGTGCTLSSSIAANLALGFSLKESVKKAKEYICGALSAGLNLGKGEGPLDHGWNLMQK